MEDLAKESDRPVMADRTHSVPPTFRRSPSRPPSRIASRKGFVRDADVTENLAGNADVAVEFKLLSWQLQPPEHSNRPPLAHSPIWARSAERGITMASRLNDRIRPRGLSAKRPVNSISL
jgi:hypothetical protein